MTNAEIKLITDIVMHLMIENGISRGGYEPTYYRAKANKQVNPNFHKEKNEESYIISLDANALYASAVCYKLPFGEPNFGKDVTKYSVDYILNLDLQVNAYMFLLYIYIIQVNYMIEILNFQFDGSIYSPK